MSLLIIFLAEYLIWFLAGWAIVKSPRAAIISLFLVWLVGNFVKNYFFIHRPFVINPLIGYKSDGSFPSNHAALAFVSAVVIYFNNRKIGILALVLAILVGLGRILGGVHTLADVLGGAGLGLIIGGLTIYHSKC